jgi:hypothetical protein
LSESGLPADERPEQLGRAAGAEFRGEVWPKADVDKMQTTLTDLQHSVQKILANISHAGGA